METTKKPQKTRLYAYVRESIDLKSGVEIQKEKINRHCNANDIVIAKWFIENDASAFKPRTKHMAMLDEVIEDDNADGVVCTSLTRFGRKTIEVLTDHDRLKSNGKKLVMVEDNIDSTTAMGTAILGIMAVCAQLERDTTSKRTTEGIAHAKIHGTKSGMPMHRPPITVDWKEYDKLYNLGLSTNAISKIIVDTRTRKHISSSALYKAVKERGQ